MWILHILNCQLFYTGSYTRLYLLSVCASIEWFKAIMYMSGYEHHIGVIYCRALYIVSRRGRRGKCDKRLIIIVAYTSYVRLALHSGLCFQPLLTLLFKKYYTYKVHVFTLLLVEVWFIYRGKCRPFLNKTLICPIKSNYSRKSMWSGEFSIIKFAKWYDRKINYLMSSLLTILLNL